MATIVGRTDNRLVASLGVMLAASLLVAGCSYRVDGTASPSPSDGAVPDRAAPTAQATAAPPVRADVFPEVLSTTTADTGTPATAGELSARQIADELEKPAGFTGISVVVASGQGSYRIAVPSSWSALWRVGTPPDEVYQVASDLDPKWAAEFRSLAADADPRGSLRSVTVDTAPGAGVHALVVTLTPAERVSGDALAEQAAGSFEEMGYPVHARHRVLVNGADGAYVEFTRPTDDGGRAAVQVRVPDPPNGLLWGLTCEGPQSARDGLRATCAQIATSFQPLPTVVG